MSELATSLIVWAITAVLGGTLLYFVKKFIDNTSRKQDQHNERIGDIAGDIKRMVQQMVDFKEHCSETEEVTMDRLNSHATDIKELAKTSAIHGTRLDGHEHRITNIEKKVG